MKSYPVGLQDDVTGTYDQTKTTILGRASQKTINAKQVVGPPLTDKFDIVIDSAGAITTAGLTFISENNRFFVLGAIATGAAQLAVYDFDLATGAKLYRGRLLLNFPNLATTTHVLRGLRVTDDAGPTGWKVWIATTGSVLINGGLFLVNNIDLTDFIASPVTPIPFATGNNQKAFYTLQDPAAMGAANAMTVAAGMLLWASQDKILIHNGVSATHQFHFFDTAIAPTYALTAVTVSVASPGIVSHTAHGYAAGDPVVFPTGTQLPTGLAFNTNYFVRNPAPNTYELSLTTGGAGINTTGVVGNANVGRAWGATGSNFVHKTGNLPALAGTMLTNNSEDGVTPQHSSVSGFECVFFSTNTNLYLGKLSELTSGVTTWASLITANLLGTGTDITAPAAFASAYSESLDLAIYVTLPATIVLKQMVNNSIFTFFGKCTAEWLETTTRPTYPIALGSLSNFEVRQGWLVVASTVVGQRLFVAMDLRSDQKFGYTSVISPVFADAEGMLNTIKVIEELYDYTDDYELYYRVSGFGSASGGWVVFDLGSLSSIAIPATGIQFKIEFYAATSGAQTPAQIVDLEIGITALNEISDNWVGSGDNSTQSGVSPAKSAFRLSKAYLSSVPKLYFRAYDDSNVLVASANTVDDAANFSYTTNNGTSWNPLGTIPNTADTTEVRYNWATPPGVKVTVSLRES